MTNSGGYHHALSATELMLHMIININVLVNIHSKWLNQTFVSNCKFATDETTTTEFVHFGRVTRQIVGDSKSMEFTVTLGPGDSSATAKRLLLR
ncbi:unnamed protein product [Urochloa humidicola]